MNKAKSQGFQCKQFFVAHDQCAMKVSTDSLILGSLVNPQAAASILDIGTGSGILALMMAQKSLPRTRILAIDIDVNAVSQAIENVQNSPWPDKISIEATALQLLVGRRQEEFDLIIANPPYFAQAAEPTKAYQTMAQNRGQARTELSLSIDDFFAYSAMLAADTSRLCCMYPYARCDLVASIAQRHGWKVAGVTHVRHNCTSKPYLSVFEFSKREVSAVERALSIRGDDNHYTPEYRALCRDFYLNF